MIHSQRRVVSALKLAPMTAEQLARCLSLHRVTVTGALSDLAVLGKVVRHRSGPRKRIAGPAPYVYEVAA